MRIYRHTGCTGKADSGSDSNTAGSSGGNKRISFNLFYRDSVYYRFYNIISSIFRGLGDSKSPMYFIGIACVMNIALDYLFMGAFHMGAAGAALGTVCAQTFSVLVALWVIRRRKTGISLKKSDFKIERAVIGQVLKIGIPVALQDGFIQVAFMIITVIANSRGVSDAAAVGVVEKVISALFIVPSSMLATRYLRFPHRISVREKKSVQRIPCVMQRLLRQYMA